jgi:hypothetical protein
MTHSQSSKRAKIEDNRSEQFVRKWFLNNFGADNGSRIFQVLSEMATKHSTEEVRQRLPYMFGGTFIYEDDIRDQKQQQQSTDENVAVVANACCSSSSQPCCDEPADCDNNCGSCEMASCEVNQVEAPRPMTPPPEEENQENQEEQEINC